MKLMKPREAKIDPKLYFASERMLINWTQAAMFVLTGALLILNFASVESGWGHVRVVGLVIGLVPLAFLLYALFAYVQRSGLIAQQRCTPCQASAVHSTSPVTFARSSRFTEVRDKYGPAVLVVSVMIIIGGA